MLILTSLTTLKGLSLNNSEDVFDIRIGKGIRDGGVGGRENVKDYKNLSH
jgi:hypothetical protein